MTRESRLVSEEHEMDEAHEDFEDYRGNTIQFGARDFKQARAEAIASTLQEWYTLISLTLFSLF
jgi:hypothetical protein